MYSEVLSVLRPFFRILQYFTLMVVFAGKVKGFRGLIFHSINKTRNLHKIRKMIMNSKFDFKPTFQRRN